jgi:hypothetical protein
MLCWAAALDHSKRNYGAMGVEKVRKVSYADVVRGTHPESSTTVDDHAVHWHVVKGKKNKRADERPRNLSFSQAN